MGPVFIIRELNKEKGEYDAFITTGGIQEVKPPVSMPKNNNNNNNNGAGAAAGHAPPAQPSQQTAATQQQQQQYPHQPVDEDSEYFGVLVTPDTVKQLDYQSTTTMNVSLSVLLVAASSRMPWLLVLRRRNYPQLFDRHQYAHAPPAQAAAGIPGMQIPQRRRYYADRQRRGLYMSPRTTATVYEEDRYPMLFERELLSTMCYNFVRDYETSGGTPGLPIVLSETVRTRPSWDGRSETEVIIDADAYAAAAAGVEQAVPPSTAQPDGEQELHVKMTIPKRVS